MIIHYTGKSMRSRMEQGSAAYSVKWQNTESQNVEERNIEGKMSEEKTWKSRNVEGVKY